MLVGYARVSTQDQNLDLQKDALVRAGCEKIVEERQSGSVTARPGLDRLFDILRPGDTLVVWRLDRLGRGLKHLIEIVNEIETRGIGFKSLTEAIDTTTTGGKLVFHIFGALAEFERNVIRERTKAGLASARARGYGDQLPVSARRQGLAGVHLHGISSSPTHHQSSGWGHRCGYQC